MDRITIIGAVAALAVLAGALAVRRLRTRRWPLRRVALTGNIASGKSAVTSVWRAAGAVIIDADDLARAAVAPGTPGLRRVLAEFGPSVRAPDDGIDRAALRAVVFSDPAKRARLEQILHPEIERLRIEEERRAAAAGARIVVHAIPLLFETGLDEQFDVIVLVDAPAAVRRARLVETRGLSEAAATAMIDAQLDARHKRARSHHVIDNTGTLAELEQKAAQVWSAIGATA